MTSWGTSGDLPLPRGRAASAAAGGKAGRGASPTAARVVDAGRAARKLCEASLHATRPLLDFCRAERALNVTRFFRLSHTAPPQ